MTLSKIEWTDRSDWNPIRGCTRKSPGCVNCYAEVMAARFSKPGQWGHGFAHMLGGDHRWTGKIEVQWDRLLLPLSWRTPAMIFGSSTSDLFHESLPADDIAQIVGVTVAAHHLRGHTTQFLTKRADRMAELMNSEAFWDVVNAMAGAHVMERVDPIDRRTDDARATLDDYGPDKPAPGVWFGVSVENQEYADERREHLRATPAAVRFVSYEPALGPVDWAGWEFVDQIIGGGESGPHARAMHPDWQRGTRDFCAANDVAYFLKQNGEWMPSAEGDRCMTSDGRNMPNLEPHGQNGDDTIRIGRIGKKAAGRLLDGLEYSEMPA